MGSARVDLDDSRFPLVVLTLKGELLDEDYDEMFSSLRRVTSVGRSYIMITDIRGITKVADAKKRRWIADRMKESDEKYGHLSVGSIMIIESALVRGSLTALQWLTGKKDRDVCVKTMHEALYEAQKVAVREGLSLPLPTTKADTA